MIPVTAEWADELAELEMVLFPENCLNEYTLARELTLGRGFAILDEGRIIAYMLLRGDEQLLDVIRLGVLPPYQGRGLGARLLRRALELSERVMLTVVPTNTKALRLYHRHGFEIVGLLKDNSGWVMQAATLLQRA